MHHGKGEQKVGRRRLACMGYLSLTLVFLAPGCDLSSRTGSESSKARMGRFWAGVRPPDDSARVLRNALILKNMGRVQLAVKELEEGCQRDPGDLRLVDALAQCYEELGAWSRAEELYRQVLAREPDNQGLANNLCFAYYQAGDLGKAEKCFREVLKRNPQNVQARNNLGLLLVRQSREKEALALWRESTGEARASQLLNQALASLGKSRAASAQAARPASSPASGSRGSLPPPALKAASKPPAAVRPAASPAPAPAGKVAAAGLGDNLKDPPIFAFGQRGPENWPARQNTSPTGPATGPSAPSAPAEAPFSQNQRPASHPEMAGEPRRPPVEGLTGASPASRPWPARLPVLTARELVDTRIQVLNGNGIQGLARRQRSWLELEGFTVAGIGNHVNFAQEHTEIRYRPGGERVAEILGSKFFRTGQVLADAGLPDRLQVRVILGRDLLQKEDILAKLAD